MMSSPYIYNQSSYPTSSYYPSPSYNPSVYPSYPSSSPYGQSSYYPSYNSGYGYGYNYSYGYNNPTPTPTTSYGYNTQPSTIPTTIPSTIPTTPEDEHNVPVPIEENTKDMGVRFEFETEQSIQMPVVCQMLAEEGDFLLDSWSIPRDMRKYDVNDLDNCDHPYIYTKQKMDYCVVCGITLSEPKPESKKKIRRVHNIVKELEKKSYPEDVRIEANRIYQEIVISGKKGKCKKRPLFYSVLQAHLKLGLPVDQYTIMEDFGLTKHEANKSISTYNDVIKDAGSFQDPVKLIIHYCGALKLDDDSIKHLVIKYQMLVEKCPSLYTNNSRPTIAAFIYYYLSINKVEVNIDEYAKLFSLSPNTIAAFRAKISSAVDIVSNK